MTFGKIIKWTFLTIGFGIFIAFSYCIYIFCEVFPSDISSKHELIDNYKKNKNDILQLKSYFNSIVPKGYTVYIEFKSIKNIDLLVYELNDKDSTRAKVSLFEQWDINPYNYNEQPKSHYDSSEYSPKTKSLELVKQKLKWTDETFKKIKAILDKANCISVSSGEPTEVGFARMGTGKYLYDLFENPIPDSLKSNYNDSCEHIYINNKLVLVWGSGVLGAQCFPDK